ncbi:YebC-like protein [Tricholoma matsutake]|nr:YebC-like protein [Tricholoma matsutake 945]
MFSRLRHQTLGFRRFLSCSRVTRSGHNKWSKIKQKKGENDAQKGTLFGKASRDIVSAVKQGGSADPIKNILLAATLKWAKEQDIPKGNIEKALAKATQGKYKEGDRFTYEALAYSVGLIIECSTDNTNRTIHSLREILNKHKAHATPVKFMFQRKGRVSIELSEANMLEEVVDLALALGADDFDEVKSGNDVCMLKFTCPPDILASLTTRLSNRHNLKVMGSDLVYVPLEPIPDDYQERKSNLEGLVSDLAANEDVLHVWTSVDF